MGPMRCGDEIVVLTSKWTIGADGAHSKTSGHPGTGFKQVARSAAGKYTVTFSRGHVPNGPLHELRITGEQAADEEGLVARPTVGGYTPETPAAEATALYESWVIDETAAQTDWPAASKVSITATFLKTK